MLNQAAQKKIEEFRRTVRGFPHDIEVHAVLDRLIAWTADRLSTVGWDSRIGDQATVKARLIPESRNYPIWSDRVAEPAALAGAVSADGV